MNDQRWVRHTLPLADRNRRTGRTLRTLWRALLTASENDGSNVVVYVQTDAMAQWTFRFLLECAGPVDGIEVKAPRRLTLPNGSRITVESDRWIRNGVNLGHGYTHELRDHSIC